MVLTDLVRAAGARFRDVKTAIALSPLEDFRAGAAPAEVEAPDQNEKRLLRLNRTASSQTAKSLVLAADAAPEATGTQHDVISTISQDRVIGTSDLVDVNFLELAIAVARGVGRVRVANGFGT